MTATAGDFSPPSEMWVGPYRLLTRIGEGGMGVVHLGQRATGERAAIKVLRPHVVSDDEARARLAREVNSLSRVRSPRVAEILDADPWGDIPYVATRYVPGLPLHRHVQEEGVLAGADLRHFAIGLAQALRAVHDVGVLHRDIKPSNVLLEGRNPVLIDFGLARLDDDMKVTRTGYLLGTPGYLAPEILFGADPSVASDIHSWAATVAFAGLGRPPFGSGHALTVMDRVRNGQHDLDGLDPALHLLVLGALDPEPTRRPTLASVLRSLGAEPGAQHGAAPASGDPHDIPFTLPFATVPTQPPVGAESLPPDSAAATTSSASSFDPPTRVDPSATPPYDPPTRVDPSAGAHPPTARQQWPAPQGAPVSPPAAPPQSRPHQQPPPVVATAHRATYPGGPPHVGGMERLRRWSLAALGAGAVVAACAWVPWVMLGCVVVAVCLLRAGSLTGSALAQRRMVRGAKWFDPVLATVTAPWHFLVSLLGSFALLIWAALFGASMLLVALALGAADHVALAVAGAVAVLAVGTGPGSSRLRSPLGRVTFPVAAGPMPWALTSAVLLLVAAGLFAGAAGGVQWLPAAEAPWADGTWLGRWL